MRDEGLYLVDILEHARYVAEDIAAGKEEFLGSRVLQGSIIRSLTVIGEAAKNVSSALKEAHPAIPWKRMAGLRDILIHSYPRIDLETVWKIATEDVPPAAGRVETILRERGVDPDTVP